MHTRRSVLATGALLGAGSLAGCSALSGESGGDPGTYRQWLPRTNWHPERARDAPAMLVVDADALEFRETAERIWTGETASTLLESEHGSCFASGGVNAVTTTSSASTVSSFLLDTGGRQLDADLPDDYAIVVIPGHPMGTLVTPDGVLWRPDLYAQDDDVVVEALSSLAAVHEEAPDGFDADTEPEQAFETLTDDVGVPDYGHFETTPPDSEVRAAASDVRGLSVAHDFGEAETDVSVSVLFAESATPTVETAREVLDVRSQEYMSDPFAEFGDFSGSTDGRFARLSATASTADFESN